MSSLPLTTFLEPGTWARNIDWTISERPFSSPMLKRIIELAGTPGSVEYIGQHYHRLVGRQLQIDKRVSDDLLVSDFTPGSGFSDVPWPAESVELYFEDESIPTAVVQLGDPSKVERTLPLEYANPEPCVVCFMHLKDGRACVLNLRHAHWVEAMRTGELPTMADAGIAMSEAENRALLGMTILALKVFAFISTVRTVPVPLTRKQMTYGGKPGVKGRPDRSATRVRYFAYTPPERRTDTGPVVPGRRFLGRRGHFRFYTSLRYVNLKGTWTYIAPVPGPDGTFPPPPTYKVIQHV